MNRGSEARNNTLASPETGISEKTSEVSNMALVKSDEICSPHDDLMTLNLRGKQFEVNIRSLEKYPESLLYSLGERWREGDNKKALFVNQNPGILHCILDYYAVGELHLPEGLCGQHVRRELAFWGVGLEAVAPCCLGKIREGN